MKKSIQIFFAASCLLGSQAFAAVSTTSSNQQQNTATSQTTKAPITSNNQVTGPRSLQPGDPQLEQWVKEVVPLANEYVKLLDRGGYADSWNYGSNFFKHELSQKGWVRTLNLARGRLGNVTSRTLQDVKDVQNPPGAPKGMYMIVLYNTSFEKAANSGETVIFIRDGGQWKIFFYQVN